MKRFRVERFMSEILIGKYPGGYPSPGYGSLRHFIYSSIFCFLAWIRNNI